MKERGFKAVDAVAPTMKTMAMMKMLAVMMHRIAGQQLVDMIVIVMEETALAKTIYH